MRSRAVPARRTAVAMIAMLALLVAGCSSGGEESAGTVELNMLAASSDPVGDKALRDVIDRYNASQSRTRVKLSHVPNYDTALKTALAGGNPPDIFSATDISAADLVKARVLAPVGDKAEAPDDFYPPLRKAFTYDGKFYCPPKDFSTLALEYNAEDLAKAGLKPPTNWDELRNAAAKLTRPGHPGLVIGPQYERWGPFFVQAGGWLTNDEGSKMTADTPGMKRALQYVTDLYRSGVAATPASLGVGWAGEALGQGKTSMIVEGTWMATAMQTDFPKLKYGIQSLRGPEGQGTLSFTVGWCAAAAGKHTEAAADVIRFLTSKKEMLDYDKRFTVIPSRPSLAEPWLDAHPTLEPFVKAVDVAHPVVFQPGFTAVLAGFNSGIEGLVSGSRQVDAVVGELQRNGTEALGGS